MRIARPTYHESWHRVAASRPRLRRSVVAHRRRFRGETWRVLEDPSTNSFHRINEAAYGFVGLLDGHTTVQSAWESCVARHADAAPTQGEALGLMARLYAENLLDPGSEGDAELLMRRRVKRIRRDVRARLASVLSIRIPLFNPDRVIESLLPLVGWLVSPVGLAVWVCSLLVGVWNVLGREQALWDGLSGVLAAENLPLLYISFVLTKAAHEFGHGVVCKALSRREGLPGVVQSMGLMILVFAPVPYVDASSAWALRRRLDRIAVGAAGMIVETTIAAAACVMWARSPEGSVAHAVAYNVILSAGVSTLVFNANPLMRFDGYFMLSDALGIPNLARRSNESLLWIIRRWIWGDRDVPTPWGSRAEAAWLSAYAVFSAVYRFTVYTSILLFIGSQQFVIGLGLAVFAVAGIVIPPIVRVSKYLLTGAELGRHRSRALWTTSAAALGLAAIVTLVPLPDRKRVPGVVEAVRTAPVVARVDGFVRSIAPPGAVFQTGAQPVVTCDNESVAFAIASAEAEVRRAEASLRMGVANDPALAQQARTELGVAQERLARAREDLAALELRAPIAGVWESPQAGDMRGRFVRRGDQLGLMHDISRLRVRAVADQASAATLVREARDRAHVRARADPVRAAWGSVSQILPASSASLPSPSLAINAGGSIETDPEDRSGRRAREGVFEVLIDLDENAPLRIGQRVVVRCELPAKPLVEQAWRAVRQTLQQRFRI